MTEGYKEKLKEMKRWKDEDKRLDALEQVLVHSSAMTVFLHSISSANDCRKQARHDWILCQPPYEESCAWKWYVRFSCFLCPPFILDQAMPPSTVHRHTQLVQNETTTFGSLRNSKGVKEKNEKRGLHVAILIFFLILRNRKQGDVEDEPFDEDAMLKKMEESELKRPVGIQLVSKPLVSQFAYFSDLVKMISRAKRRNKKSKNLHRRLQILRSLRGKGRKPKSKKSRNGRSRSCQQRRGIWQEREPRRLREGSLFSQRQLEVQTPSPCSDWTLRGCSWDFFKTSGCGVASTLWGIPSAGTSERARTELFLEREPG